MLWLAKTSLKYLGRYQWRIQGGRPGVWSPPSPQRPHDTKIYLRIYEDLDGGFVGDKY